MEGWGTNVTPTAAWTAAQCPERTNHSNSKPMDAPYVRNLGRNIPVNRLGLTLIPLRKYECLFASIGFDTAKNEPSQICQLRPEVKAWTNRDGQKDVPLDGKSAGGVYVSLRGYAEHLQWVGKLPEVPYLEPPTKNNIGYGNHSYLFDRSWGPGWGWGRERGERG